ncbi:YvcK family protein [Candidatus Minimicrobia naudis]|uniref:YvcK family protein n=1 Tax=Candidatus Minimicrobia naudis TaxID=2841263 RepID=A0A8F1SBD9_9BACT|nr:YvcK family protein [Candidatus Minimicrobia naudis]
MSIKLKDGTVVDGQHAAESLKIPRGERPWLEPETASYNQPESFVKQFWMPDLVVIAPGLLYGSLTPALLVRGVTRALAETKAKKVYVCNLVTKPTQTDGFTVADFADEIERFSGVNMDYVL